MKLVIVDAYNFIFRAFHSLPKLTNNDGVVVNAVFGYIRMLLKYKQKFPDSTFVVVADTGTRNFRHSIYPEYKANRQEVDPLLVPQFDMVRCATMDFNMPYLAFAGFEADDVIASLCGVGQIIIVSSDKDLLQLVDERITVLDPNKDVVIDAHGVKEKMGVAPVQIPDYLALTGDSSDNIPGVRGIGPKTAALLLEVAPNVEYILQNKDEMIKGHPKLARHISAINDDVLLSKRLTTLLTDIPVPDIAELAATPLNPDGLREFLRQNQFNAVIPKVDELFPPQREQVEKTTGSAVPCGDLMLWDDLQESIRSGYGVMFIMMADASITVCDVDKNYAIVDALDVGFRALLSDAAILKVTTCAADLLRLGVNVDSLHDIVVMAYSADMISNESFGDLCSRHGVTSSISGMVDIFRIMQEGHILTHVYECLDRPIVSILSKMEVNGIAVDRKVLEGLTEQLSDKVRKLEDKIYFIAGEPFNIGSPKQLATIMHGKLGIALGKKSKKTKEYSTNVTALEGLVDAHPIVEFVLEWRHLSKIINTYTNGLLKYIKGDGRIHTNYRIESTSTGRISSQNPNMQNIPIKSEVGRRIRGAFIAKEDYTLIAADYSQIELRLLAHISGEDVLIDQINNGVDIHSLTASQIFHIPIDQVTEDSRRRAKAVNFGIVYGLTPFGLAQQLKISNFDASMMIEAYLKRYPMVAKYIDKTKKLASENGYVETITGRRCRTDHINSKNFVFRQYAERAAVNAPLQGSAADILKYALIALDRYISKERLDSKISLQIHDEIIVESPNAEVEHMKTNMKKIMESVVSLKVVMEANVRSGSNLIDLS